MTGSTHTLPILIEYAWSMARVWLEYGYSMARVWLEHGRRLQRHTQTTGQRMATAWPQRCFVVSMLLFLTVGSGSVWGQTDYSGTYYIASVDYDGNTENKNNFYLCPTEGWCYYKATNDFTGTDNGMPFLTTYRCKSNNYHSGNASTAVWYVEKHPTLNYYYIKQASTGRYLTSNGQIRTTTNADRMRVHLETVTPENLDDKELFTIAEYTKDSKTYLTISPKGVVGGAADRNWLVVNGGNVNNLKGASGKTGGPGNTADQYQNTKGIVGVYTQNDASAPFYLEKAISIDPPTITNNFTAENTFTITAAEGATIYYTTDGTTPTTETTTTGTTSVNITQTESLRVIKALAKATSDNFPTPVVTYILPVCERPAIKVGGGTVTITCSTAGAVIRYTTDGSPATASSTLYSGPFAKGDASTIRAVATKAGYVISSEAVFLPPTEVSSSDEITDMNGNYVLANGFSSSGSIGTSDNPFKGTIDGDWNQISLGYPLVAYADGAIIKNVIIDNVSISSGTNVGAICGEATGDTRIYNCGVLGGSVGGSNNVGGIVGLLDGRARVVNCYNYAKITSGSNCGGIVGYNNVASTSSNLQTMVMNCMFYGNITGGNAAPIYGGAIIHNKYASDANTGLNNYCYFLYDEEKNPYVKTIANDKYHGALGAEERFLNRFEFFRMTLNSTRNLAAYYVTGDATQKGEIAKWVLDKSIAPYPILKVQGTYPSIVNPDAAHATTQTERNKGGLLGTLSVTISGTGSGAVFSAPTGASITTIGSLTLNITDKDEDNFNFNYKKVQLPYYNEVGTGNYTGDRVVTGWKITSITGGTSGSFTTDTYNYPSFNFVDRKCTNKDLYSVSGRVFAQGAYWEVPDGVTAITIEPYWAKAVYLSDAHYDMTYTITISGTGSGATATANKYGVTVCGSCPTVCNEQTVYTDLSTAMTNLGSNADHKVYDYAVVLVGNYHQAHNNALVGDGKPVTFMSADLDGDNEPDNTLFYYHNQRRSVSPIRFDFLNIPGIGMVKRTHDATMDPEPGILCPQGWFEITNTVFIRFGQFEYAGSNTFYKTTLAPLILQGGIYEQFVSCCRTNARNTNYLLIGGNAWFLNFANGCHTAQANTTPKVPVNVTGGDYTNFYLTGIYQPAAAEASENAECYIDGGRFTEVAGSGMQQIKGDVTWLINAADITSFYGGGINAAKPITGSISTTISNSYVDEFYGGPKFGDMVENKTVTTNATDCHFGKYFGAGYGGTAFNRVGYEDSSKPDNSRTWDTWVTDYYGRAYDSKNGGISTNYEYEFILHSDGNQTVARFFVNYASLSLASTRNVTNTLLGCTIGTFYGGGSLGAVNGDINSTLTNCTVTGNAFGAGFSASVPTVEVWNAGANLVPNPTYNRMANVFNNASVKTPKDNNQYIEYTWSKTQGSNESPFVDTEDGKHYIHTDVSLDGLGSVSGNAILNIEGTTTVGGNVYGGGEESGVGGSTQVFINNTGTAGTGNVFGAGKGLETNYEAALVKGNSTVTMSNGTVKGNIYGGGELSSVGTFTRADAAYHTAHPTVEVGMVLNYTAGGTTTVTISGGTVGNSGEYVYDSNSRLAHTNGGNVFAGCKGVLKKSDDSYLTDWIKFARVKNTVLTVSGENTRIMSSIYGGGEIGSVGYLDESGALVEGCGTSVTVSGGTIGTEIKNNDATEYTFGSVFGGGYGSDLETTIPGQTDPNAPKLFAGRVYGNTSVTMTDGAVKASVYGGGEMASVNGNAEVAVSGGSVGIDKVGDKQFGGPTMGNVYGGGSGNKNIVRAGQIFGNTNVNISQAESKTTRIYHNVYGGGAYGSVGTFEYHYTYEADGYEGIAKVDGITSCADNTGMATVTITGGTIGADGKENGMIFGSSRGDVGAPGSRDDLVAWVNTTNVTIGDASSSAEDQGPTIKGSVYGSGENGHTLGDAVVTVENGTIGIHDGTAADGTRGNVYGCGCGTDKYYEDPAEETYDGNGQLYNPKAGIVQGTATVTINGGYVLHNVYGAGAMGPVGIDGEGHKTTVNINGGRIGYDGTDNGNVYGGARGAQGIGRNFAYVGDTEVNVNYATTPDADNEGKTEQLIAGSVFGGGEAGSVHGGVVVNMNKGLVLYDVYGGGALADTNTDNWGTDTWAEGKTAASNTTFVHLKGGTVTGNVYGGGLGKMAVGEKGKTGYEPAIEAKVYGNTTVELNKTVADEAKGCIVKGSIFGCNNMSGSPQASTTVHIYKTQRNGASRITNTTEVTNAKVKGIKTDGEYDPSSFDIQAVYGGGNLAAYEPVDQTNGTTNVIIDGCERTSICQVYGGGNAASTPATTVTINGTFEIGELFGGGNGKDDIVKNNVTLPNPGANVGYKDYSEYYKDDNNNWKVKDKEDADTKEERTGSAYEYGTGVAAVNVFGGLVHRVFGGSNTKGNVRQTALTLMDENNECPFCVDEAYGGGKEAEMDAEGKLLMACIPGLDAVYGGAEAADVKGGVELNITNGIFGRVFGGNNISGTICGPIKVNIKEVGCKPIIIGELYGGGNQAAYSIYGYDSDNKPIESGSDPWDDPEVNVTSFTSIGEIYGGGYGRRAVMVGNPKVSISEAIGTPDTYPTTGDFDETGFKGKTFTFDVGKETEHTVTCPPHVKGKIGVINKVFGGGNAAQVNGNTYVNIGTTVGDVIYEEVEVKVGVTVVTGYYTRSGAGTAESPYTYAVASADAETCDADGKAVTGMSYYRKLAIIGVDIRGNVYGGGNNAEVTGDSKVKIGKKNE